MVYSEERVREFAMERSKPLLHNFSLPFLKWGAQRQLRCMKLSPADSAAASSRTSRLPPSKFSERFKSPPRRIGSRGAGGAGEGIEEMREKIMLDLKTAANKMKDEILRKEVSGDDDDDDDGEEYYDEDQERVLRKRSPSPAVAAAAEHESRPWNLRTRRAACKAPVVGGNSGVGKLVTLEEKKAGSSQSPPRSENGRFQRIRGEKREREAEEKEEERVKFSVALSRSEIGEDFAAMVSHRPARRPKKRPRNVQRQLDMLFPGLWLTEVTLDTYKVPEVPDNGKR